ncbi:MAG TPA: UBP-type zinc finger domain-containing protein [Gaiellaceae bacterium]|jgi:uncharacterized UBP type Zn finger protein
MDCSHLDEIALETLPESVDGCAECLRDGGEWFHLRICLSCGHVGCCDSSPGRHATAHAHETLHHLIRSLEPGEAWSWCYVDEVAFVVDTPTGTTRIPPSPMLS